MRRAVELLDRLVEIGVDDPVLRPAGLAGTELTLRRAWPRSEDRLTLEYTGADRVVAGEWHAEGGGGRIVLYPLGTDRRLPGLRPALERPDARLLAHRAGRRAVVALDGAFLKVMRPGAVSAVARAHRQAAAAPGVVVPAVRGCDDSEGTLELATLGGRSLHELLAGDGGPGHLHAVGAATRRLHDGCPVTAAAVHGAAAEARVLDAWLERLRPFGPRLHARLSELARPTLAALRCMPTVARATLHRDLHDKQVLLDADGNVGFIDLDTLTAGDPAVDVGNLLAHLRLRAIQADSPPEAMESQRAALLDGYGPSRAVRDRLEPYERASLLRLACVYAFRPRRPDLPERLAAAAASLHA